MKKLVKVVACACLALCCAFMLTACGGSVEGTYSLYSMSGTIGTTTITITADEYDAIVAKQEAEETLTMEEQTKLAAGEMMFGSDMKFILEADGVFKQSMTEEPGEEATVLTGTWELDGETLSLTINDETQTATIKDGKITMEMMGTTIVLKK